MNISNFHLSKIINIVNKYGIQGDVARIPIMARDALKELTSTLPINQFKVACKYCDGDYTNWTCNRKLEYNDERDLYLSMILFVLNFLRETKIRALTPMYEENIMLTNIESNITVKILDELIKIYRNIGTENITLGDECIDTVTNAYRSLADVEKFNFSYKSILWDSLGDLIILIGKGKEYPFDKLHKKYEIICNDLNKPNTINKFFKDSCKRIRLDKPDLDIKPDAEPDIGMKLNPNKSCVITQNCIGNDNIIADKFNTMTYQDVLDKIIAIDNMDISDALAFNGNYDIDDTRISFDLSDHTNDLARLRYEGAKLFRRTCDDESKYMMEKDDNVYIMFKVINENGSGLYGIDINKSRNILTMEQTNSKFDISMDLFTEDGDY